MKKIKILTFNTGLFRLRFWGIDWLKTTDFVEERLRQMPTELLNTDADVIALQEVFNAKHQLYLIQTLQEAYPYHCFTPQKWIKLNAGLMIFSKYPISNVVYTPLRDTRPVDEMLVACKGILSCYLNLQDIGNLHIINIHPTSGGFLYQQADNLIVKVRNNQINQAYQLANQSSSIPSVILGDFNAGPEIAESNYQNLLNKNFIDAYAAHCEATQQIAQITWDAHITLNRRGTHANSCSQRIDHLYISPTFKNMFQIDNIKVVFQNPLVNTPLEKVHLSDHYGLYAIFSYS